MKKVLLVLCLLCAPSFASAPVDYDGDGKTDIGVFRPSTGQWFFIYSKTNTFVVWQFGQEGDIPAPGDYDGDGTSDFAVFRPSTSTWFIHESGKPDTYFIRQFGQPGDIPLTGVR